MTGISGFSADTTFHTNISIIIPIHNEASILEKFISTIHNSLDKIRFTENYELLLIENGSTDNTLFIAKNIEKDDSLVKVESLPKPSYGKALKYGIDSACGEILVIFNADFWDIEFLSNAKVLLEKYDIIVGSKNIPGSKDLRPLSRRIISKLFSQSLQILFFYNGTDTHGIKALKTKLAKQLVKQCKTSGEIFDTEMLLIAQKNKHSIFEIPVSVKELRPSRTSIWRRIPSAIVDLMSIFYNYYFS